MLTYGLLALAAMFVLNRWVQLYKMKRDTVSPDIIDSAFRSSLNDGEAHDK